MSSRSSSIPTPTSPHGSWELPGGPKGFKRIASIIRTAFPDLTRKIEDMVAEGDKVFLNSTFMGPHTGASEFAPSTPSGDRWGFPESRPSSLAGGRIFDEPWARNDIPCLVGEQAAAKLRYMDEASNKGNASIVDMG